MTKSKVFFAPTKERSRRDNYLNKLEFLWNSCGGPDIYKKRDIVALKVHFGEKGNSTFLKPIYVAHIVKLLKQNGAKPFLTDTATLYAGSRTNAVDHVEIAIQHGFSYATINAPLIMADGLFGRDEEEIAIEGGKYFKKVYLGRAIVDAPKLVVISHFKFHEITGFGGTLKNLAMGCASRRGKLAMHSHFKPSVDKKKCVACGYCIKNCPVGAISFKELSSGRKIAEIDPEKCIGCGECLANCRFLAIGFDWNAPFREIGEKIVEYAKGVIKNKEKVVYINIIENITPVCDCFSFSDERIVPDIGIAASLDPVALDQACCDLVNQANVNRNSRLKDDVQDKFKALYPQVDWEAHLEYAKNLGLGNREYELVKFNNEK
jgi:uncharacterized Fe-S center protein